MNGKPTADKTTITICEEGTVLETETDNDTLWYLEHPEELERDRRDAVRAITMSFRLGEEQGMREWAARAGRLYEIACWADHHMQNLRDEHKPEMRPGSEGRASSDDSSTREVHDE